MARKPKFSPTDDAEVLVPKVTPKRFFGLGLPGVEIEKLSGKLIVVEGADGSGRRCPCRFSTSSDPARA